MNDPRLLTLLTLVQVKNYTKTAQRLFITQPAVTHHIKSLETEFDIILFTGNKGFELTKQGQILVEYARRMMNQSRELIEAISDSLSLKKTLALGVTNEAIALLSKKNLLSRLFEVYNSNANLMTLSSADIYTYLKEGKLDFAIVDGPYDDDSFDGILLDTMSIVPVCYTEGKFKEIKRVTRDMIKNNPIILGAEGNGMCEGTLYNLKSSNINITQVPTFHSNSPFLLGELIKSTDGIGFMYAELCEQLKDVKRMDLLNFKATQGIYLVYSQNSFDKPTLKALVKVLKKWKERS
ncbi:MAG: LysR family transcriptional regulator [Roseburia sp.]|nr:LysR family transcriptional regulator [Anaeroplasma bactoclasticum]MCM1197111.1 LysR family transcriptional regulator [Roseburia sp.]MCM1556498.1 LysR family transcriptional regulator [Anaeroplasma bactoclasticum]